MKTKAMLLAVVGTALASGTPAMAEDAYVESDGTQYINLGYRLNPRSRVVYDFALTEAALSTDVRPIGARGGQNMRIYTGGDNGAFTLSFTVSKGTSTQSKNSTVAADTERHVATFDYGAAAEQCTVSLDDGAFSHTFTGVSTATSSQPLIVFAENLAAGGIYSEASASGYYLPAKARVYGVTIYEDGTEVLKFTPCVKGGVAGLKEEHTGLFHTSENQLAHPLAYGGDILTEKDDPYVWMPRNTTATVGEVSTMLDTGYTVKRTTRVELDYAAMTPDWTTESSWEDPYLISTKANASGDLAEENFQFWMNSASGGGTFRYAIGQSGGQAVSAYPIATAYNVRRTVSMSGSDISVATAGYTNFTATVATAKQVSRNLDSFTLKIGAAQGGYNHYTPMKIYGLKIWEGTTLVKDYVPFVENGVGGFTNALDAADRLTSRTRTNYSMTVSDGVLTNVVFDVGGDVAAPAAESEAYLEFTGANGNSINTGHVVTKDTCIEMDYSLWNTKYNNQQFLFEQAARATGTSGGMWARVYYGGSSMLSYSMCDNDGSFKAKATTVKMSNDRQTLTLDSFNGKIKVVRGGETLYDKTFAQDGYNYARTATTCVTNLWIGGNWSGTSDAASMRLYSFKISEAGELKHCFVPYRNGEAVGLYDTVTSNRFPLVGGKVGGMKFAGESFQVAPEATRVSYGRTKELRCFAAGAQRYEWRKNGEPIDGETGETLTVAWEKIETDGHTVEYSVRPVYSVFNETVIGEAATAEVTCPSVGMAIILK